MNRTVRGLAIFAIGVGAWACKGDPQSSLNRGQISSVNANPASIFLANGATEAVLVDARDELNQAVEITAVSEAAGSGITYLRDYLYQPVYDAGATDAASCGAIPNSNWTGTGCLVPRTNPTRLRYTVTGTVASATSFAVTINGSTTLSIPVTVTPVAVPAATSATPTAQGGASIVAITSTDPSQFAFDPASTQVIEPYAGFPGGGAGPAGFVNVGAGADSSFVAFVPAPGASGNALVQSVLFLTVPGLSLTVPTDIAVDGPASTFSGNCSTGAESALLAPGPANGASETFYDGWRCGTGTQRYTFVAGGTGDHTFTFGWDTDGDIDYGVTDFPATAFLCSAGSLANPEVATCAGLTVGTTYGIRMIYYSDTEPAVVTHTTSLP